MYKIENLNSLVNDIKSNDENVLPDNLISFAQKMKKIESEFVKIGNEYEIVIMPQINETPSLMITLCYEDKPLYKYNTALDFYQHNGFYSGVGEDYDNVENVITFNDNPELYKDIIEDKLINSFLENEKAIRKLGHAKNALRTKNIYIR